MSDRRQIHGLPVAVWGIGAGTQELVFSKVREALELISHHDARAFGELVDHTCGIFVFGTIGGVAAEWWRDEGFVVLQSEYLFDASTSSQAVAVVLVHEATHVWLERLGFHYAAGRRTRFEGICNRRARRLARRLPDAENLVSSLSQNLRPKGQYLTDQAFHERAIAELVRLGVPAWFLRQMDVWSKRLHRLTSAWSRPA